MAALPLYLLSLVTITSNSSLQVTSEFQWVQIHLDGSSIVTPRDSFVWDSVARFMLSDVVDSGYAFATLSVAGSKLVHDTLMLYTELDHGPAVTITSLEFSGDRKTNPSLLAHLMGFQPFRYSTTRVIELVDGLEELDCSVLDWEILTTQDGDSIESPATIHFLIAEVRSPNRITALVGYGDEEGFIGMVDLLVFNLFGGRRKFSFSWQRFAPSNVNFALTIQAPYPFHLPFGAEAGGAFRSFDVSTYHLEASAGMFITPGVFELGLGYAYEQDRVGSTQVGKHLASTRLTAGPFGANIRAGERRAEAGAAYFKASAKAGLLVPLVWRFSFWLEPNASVVASGATLLETELIRVGGARTLRGYVEEEFRSDVAFWSRQELRWGSDVFSLYPLFDAAWVDGAGFAAGYGAGIAVKTPIGRLELDAALPWDGAWQDAKLHLSLDAEF
jgi:outer membrane protein assembly factor BamA